MTDFDDDLTPKKDPFEEYEKAHGPEASERAYQTSYYVRIICVLDLISRLSIITVQ